MMTGLDILAVICLLALLFELIFTGYAIEEEWCRWYIPLICITMGAFVSTLMIACAYKDWEEGIKAQCITVKGIYGGGKCYKDGKEVVE